MSKKLITIVPAAQAGAYWINTKFVFAENWKISKERFTLQEQKEFQKYLKDKD